MEKIKVSIIIPVYNSEKYAERCIRSAINQTLKEIEIIVVNDGSSDNTQHIAEQLVLEDDRVLIINKSNGGLSSARNAGLDIAQGEYIQHLDGDDWIESTACEESYKYASGNNIDIVICDCYSDDDNGNIKYRKDLKFEKNIYSNEKYLWCFFQRKSTSAMWSKFIKRELYENIRHPVGISIGEDLATIPKLTLNAKNIGRIDKAFVHHILNLDSITNQGYSKKMYETFKAHDTIEEFFKDNKAYEKYKDGLLSMRHFSFVLFFVQKPFYSDNNYQKGLNYMLSYLKHNDTIKNTDSTRYILVKILKFFPYKIVFYTLNFVFYLSPF